MTEDNKEIENVDAVEVKNEQVYSSKIAEIDNESRESKVLLEKKSQFESKIQDTLTLSNNIEKYLDRTGHPKKAEYKSIIEDIKGASYNVADENDHINYVAAKLFLEKDSLPDSLKNDYEVVSKSSSLTPANAKSLEKLKNFTEQAIESKNKQAQRHKLVADFGNRGDHIEATDFRALLRAYDRGAVTKDEYNAKRKEFLEHSAEKMRINNMK